MTELLAHFKLGVNFETETRLAGEWVCSCPKQVLNVMVPPSPSLRPTLVDSYADFHLQLHQLESIKAQQTALHSKMQHDFRQHTKAPRVGYFWGQEMTNSDTASRQPVFTWFLNQPAKNSGSSSYSLTFWEYISSQASHC